jgi:hypothetical protein
MRLQNVIAFSALVVAIAGCQSSPPPIVEVEGVVMLDGKPLPLALVQFYPMHEGLSGLYIGSAVTDDQGRFKLTCNGQTGACACENKITITEGPLPDDARGMSAASQLKASKYLAALKNRPIPPKYANLVNSDLSVKVVPGTKEYNLDITR